MKVSAHFQLDSDQIFLKNLHVLNWSVNSLHHPTQEHTQSQDDFRMLAEQLNIPETVIKHCIITSIINEI